MIYIIRHGQTNWNIESRNMGRIDIELNETGIKQAEMVKNELKSIKFDKVFSSPLKRAYKTAEIIYDGDIIKDDRIIERANGKLEGKLVSEFVKPVDFSTLNENEYGIEPVRDFRKRINNFLDEITTKYKDKNILIVTHSGVSIYINCYFNGEPTNGDYDSLKLKNCEIFKYNNSK